MTEPSPFLCGLAVVFALAPKSVGPFLLAWAAKYAKGDQFCLDLLDTAGRGTYFALLIVLCRLFEAII